MLCSFFANLHLHYFLELIVLNFIITILQYFCIVDFQKIHITMQTTATKNNRVGTEFYFVYWIILNYFLTFILSPTVVCFGCTNIHSDLIFLGEFIRWLTFSRQKISLSRHTVLDISPWFIQVVTFFYQWKNQTLCGN